MDKLEVINSALILTGNNPVNVLNSSEDEYIVSNAGFERAVKHLVSRHNWPFAETTEDLVRVADADNPSKSYSENGFQLTSEVLHVREAYYLGQVFTDYEIVGRVLSCPYSSDIAVKCVKMPANAAWHPMAEEILIRYVESACEAGLNEDKKEARVKWEAAESLLIEGRTHVNQQNPARNIYKSSIRAARNTRRR